VSTPLDVCKLKAEFQREDKLVFKEQFRQRKRDKDRVGMKESYIYRKMKERAKIHPSSLAVPSAACQASCHTAINNAVPVQ